LQQGNPGPVRRRWRWIALVALIPLAVFSITLAIAWRMGSTRLDKAIARLDKLDPRWRFDDLQTDRLPFPPANLNGSAQIEAIGLAQTQGGYGHWSFPQYESNPEKLERARQAMDKSLAGERQVPALLSEEEVRVLKAEEVKAGKALPMARDLVRFPYGRFSIAYPKNIWATSLASLQQARPVASMLRYDAILRAHNGDLAGALQDVKAIFHAGRAIGDEPFLIAMLIRIAMDHVAVNTLERSLGLGETTDNELMNIQSYLQEQTQIPYFLQGLRGERAADDRIFEAIQNGDLATRDLIRLAGPTGMAFPLDYLLAIYTSTTLPLRRAEMLELMTEAVEAARLPTELQAATFKGPVEKIRNLSQLSIARWILPAVEKVGEANIRNQAVLRTAIVGVAAERFRLANKRWPNQLAELTPSYLEQLPVDPFDGQPLRMKQADGSFTVYSIGMDRIDNQGQLDVKPFQPGSDIGCRLFDPANRRQPAKPFVIDQQEENEDPN
jgi:hypothetical protein